MIESRQGRFRLQLRSCDESSIDSSVGPEGQSLGRQHQTRSVRRAERQCETRARVRDIEAAESSKARCWLSTHLARLGVQVVQLHLVTDDPTVADPYKHNPQPPSSHRLTTNRLFMHNPGGWSFAKEGTIHNQCSITPCISDHL